MSGDFGFLFKGNSFVHLTLGTKTATHAVPGCQIHHGDPLNRAHCVRFMALPYKDTQQRNVPHHRRAYRFPRDPTHQAVHSDCLSIGADQLHVTQLEAK